MEKEYKPQKFKISDVLEDMVLDLKNGKEKGSTTHIPELDECWTWRKEEFNIWTGYANEGKSLFLRYLCILKALKDDWRFIFCAPEDYPAKEFFDDMIHTLTGMSTDRDRPNHVTEDMYRKAANKIKDNFIFLYIEPPHNTVKGVLEEFRTICNAEKIDGCIIDPILKFARPKGFSDRDDIYASYIGSICVDFARQTRTSLNMVMHQVTPTISDDRKYPEPSMYRVKGGGSWADGADNVLSIWRPSYAFDKTDTEVQFASQKIKKQKLVGIPQKYKMRFDRRSNRYVDFSTGNSLFKFEL
jgi:twinkle protein